ncbi:unnamed protein product [Euphydryas editha]|uniref:Uncharacterized protein n=1 Tax=Euphydryas editha TaxID=104508 RepID=A0AAU9UAB6_EUPED|nr:unnamed protein product [Euphydryas editha]
MVDCTESNKNLEENRDEDIKEWSDDMCIRIATEDNFPAKVKDLSVQKDIINRFLNFYLSGKVQKGLSAKDIIFAAISIMPCTMNSEEFIWQNAHYSQDGTLFFLTPECKLKTEIKNVMMKHKQNSADNKLEQQQVYKEQNVTEMLDGEPHTDSTFKTNDVDFTELPLEELMWFRKKSLYKHDTTMNIQIKEYGPVENLAFCKSCNELLAKWETDMIARLKLKYFFGIAALSLMRSIVKSYQHVMKMFTSTFPSICTFPITCSFPITFAYINDYIIYSPPSELCVKKTFKTFRKLERKVQIMFAKLVIESFFITKKKQEDEEGRWINTQIKNVFHVTVLAHTSNYGMEIINMLQEVACRGDFLKIFKAFRTEETAISWNKVNDFLKKYLCQSSCQVTCYWARVIDKEQFKYLSCEKNYELAVIIAVYIEHVTGNKMIWNARWVKSGTNLEKYKQLGHKIYEEIIKNYDDEDNYRLLFLDKYIESQKYID